MENGRNEGTRTPLSPSLFSPMGFEFAVRKLPILGVVRLAAWPMRGLNERFCHETLCHTADYIQLCQVQFSQTLPGYLPRPSMTPWEMEPHGASLGYSRWSGGKGGAEVFCFLLAQKWNGYRFFWGIMFVDMK